METKTVMGYPITSIPIQETQFEAYNAMLVNLVDMNVLMLLWANLSRHLDRCMLRMHHRDISSHLLVSRVRLHAVLVTIKHPLGKLPVLLLMQATMFLARLKRARLLVLREPLAARQDRARVLTLQQDILCHLLVRRVRLHAVLVTIRHLPGKLPVMLLMQATMFLARPKRARPLVLREPIKQAQDNPRVTMLMQATMFLAQPKRARLLVLLEPLAVRQARSIAPMRCQAIMYQFRVNQAQQSA